MSIELQYTNFAKFDVNPAPVGVFDANPTPGPDPDYFSGNSVGAAGLYHFNPDSDFSPFIKLGWHAWHAKIETIYGSEIYKTNESDAFYSVGIDGKINEKLKYLIEFERMKIKSRNANVDNIGIAVITVVALTSFMFIVSLALVAVAGIIWIVSLLTW